MLTRNLRSDRSSLRALRNPWRLSNVPLIPDDGIFDMDQVLASTRKLFSSISLRMLFFIVRFILADVRKRFHFISEYWPDTAPARRCLIHNHIAWWSASFWSLYLVFPVSELLIASVHELSLLKVGRADMCFVCGVCSEKDLASLTSRPAHRVTDPVD